jgi:hypothetical protein
LRELRWQPKRSSLQVTTQRGYTACKKRFAFIGATSTKCPAAGANNLNPVKEGAEFMFLTNAISLSRTAAPRSLRSTLCANGIGRTERERPSLTLPDPGSSAAAGEMR